MNYQEALEVLGVEAGSSAAELKRAYRRLLKVHKPDRDPDGFQRLREAYEIAKDVSGRPPLDPGFGSGVVDDAYDPATANDPTGATPPLDLAAAHPLASEIATVHAALDEGRIRDAYDLVTQDQWAGALLDDTDGQIAYTIHRVGCGLVLLDWPLVCRLHARYTEIVDMPSEPRLILHEVSGDWWELVKQFDIPKPLSRFAALTMIAQPAQRVELARDLADWYWSDPAGALDVFEHIDKHSKRIVSFLVNTTMPLGEGLDPSPDTLPVTEHASPTRVLALALFPTAALALIVAALVIMFLPADPKTQSQYNSIAVLAPSAGVLFLGSFLFTRELRRRYLDACLRIDANPVTAVPHRWLNPFLHYRFPRDGVLSLGFAIGRLGRLEGATKAGQRDGD